MAQLIKSLLLTQRQKFIDFDEILYKPFSFLNEKGFLCNIKQTVLHQIVCM
jgi:hypothetical protein